MFTTLHASVNFGAMVIAFSLLTACANQSPILQVTARAPMWVPEPIPAQAPAFAGVAHLPNANLWYWDTGGSGPAVIFLHAGSQSGAGWVYQQPVFAAAGYRVIAYSRRGYFGSEAGDPTNPGFAAEDLDHLIDYLKLGKVHIVAIAHGGFFALDYVLAHPEKVRSLTVVSSLMGIDKSETDYQDVTNRLHPKSFNALPNEFKELHPSYRAGNPAGLAAWCRVYALVQSALTPSRGRR
jgi:pimeloyl-ACP methyl ester carboxylesterase